jgi:hypothetical protein
MFLTIIIIRNIRVGEGCKTYMCHVSSLVSNTKMPKTKLIFQLLNPTFINNGQRIPSDGCTLKMTHSQVTGWNPLEGSTKSSCGKLRLGGLNLHQNKPPTWLVHIPGHPWVLGQATGTFDHETHHGPDSGVSHHLTPYSILCDTPQHPRPNVTFSRDSRVGVPKLSRNCLGWSPGTLGAHNSRLRSLIATRSEPNL